MDFSVSNGQAELRQEVITFARDKLADPAGLETFSREQFDAFADFGFLGIAVGEEYDGLGESYLTSAIALEALGYACNNNGLIFVVNNHIWVCQNIIYLYGGRSLKAKYLPDMIAGKKIGAVAITEAEAGSDALAISATATVCDSGYILNGAKMFISNGPIADIFVVFAVTQTKPTKKITAFVVEKAFGGVMPGLNIEKMGLNSCPTSEVVFDNVFIPKENVLGWLNMGGAMLTQLLQWERFYEFVPHIGAMQRVLEQCMTQASVRKQFGRSIGSFQSVSNKIADMKTSIEMARLMMYNTATLFDQGKPAYLAASMFKVFVSERYIQTCRDAMQIFGAYGYTKEYGLERELRDALACSIYSGTNEMQRNTIFNMTMADAGLPVDAP